MTLGSLVLVIIRVIREIRGQILTTDFTDDTDNGGRGKPTSQYQSKSNQQAG